MGNKSKIEWTDHTRNPIVAVNRATGKRGWFCIHASDGCWFCYAEKCNQNTFFGNGLPYKRGSLDLVDFRLNFDVLSQAVRQRKPSKTFWCSMTDMFG